MSEINTDAVSEEQIKNLDTDKDDDSLDHLVPSDLNFKKFFKLLFQCLGLMILKFAVSRKGMTMLVHKVIGYILLFAFAFDLVSLESGKIVVILYSVIAVFISTYQGIIQWEKIKASANFGK